MTLTGRYKHGHFALVGLEEEGSREQAKQEPVVRLTYWLTYACRWTEGKWPFRQCLAHPSQDIFHAKEQVSGHKVLLWEGQGFQVPGGLQQITHLLYEVLGGWGHKASSPCIWEAIWSYDPVTGNRLKRRSGWYRWYWMGFPGWFLPLPSSHSEVKLLH